MKKSSKVFCLLAAVLMLFTLNVTAFASNETNDGNIKIQVATDKGSYGATGVAEITATITNVSDEDINNVIAQAVFDDLAPAGKRTSKTSKSVDVLKAGESFSFTYKATLNKDEHELNIFQKIILWFVRLFNGGYNANNNNIDVVAECITEIRFDKFLAENIIQVGYDIKPNNDTYEGLIKDVDIDEPYDYENADIAFDEETKLHYVTDIIILMFDFDCSDEEKAEAINYINGKVVGGREGTLYVKINKKTASELRFLCEELSEKYRLDAFYDEVFLVDEISSYIPNDKYSENNGEYVPNWVKEADGNIDPNWHHLAIQSTEAWDYKDYFESIDIGVVDSGFDYTHEDLDITILSKKKDITNHGTHVAGLIGAKSNNRKGVSGVAWESNLYGYSVNGASQVFRSQFYEGLAATVKNGCKIINFSQGFSGGLNNSDRVYYDYNINNWGKEASKEMVQLLKKGYDFVVVQSSGNGASDQKGVDSINNGLFCSVTEDNAYKDKTISAKEILDRIIAVAATDNINGAYRLTPFSNGGSCDIAAPGEHIYSTVAGIEDKGNAIVNNQKYGWLSGTSMAAPIVAGVVGMVWSVNKDFSGAEVKDIVISTAKKGNIWAADNSASPTTGSFPLVNAKLAVEEAIKRTYEGTVTGIVTDDETNQPISGVTVEVLDNSSDSFDPVATATTDSNGIYTLKLPYGDYSIAFDHADYEYYGTTIFVNAKQCEKNVALSHKEDNEDENGDENGNGTSGGNENGKENEEGNKTPIVASGNCGAEGDNIIWVLHEDGELVISGSGKMKDYGMDDTPLYFQNEIKRVVVNSGVTSIGNNAFRDLKGLTSITIPRSVISIGVSAFCYCSSLISITIPDNVNIIGNSAFYATAYYNDESNWKNGVLYVGNHLIDAKNYISDSYSIELGTKTIANNAFGFCRNLTSVIIPVGVTSIGDCAFQSCESLTNIIIPNSVVSIGYAAFRFCDSIVSVTIPDSVTNIGELAFNGCFGLTSITIPDSVTNIGENAFHNCSVLSNISVDKNNLCYSSDKYGVLFNKEKSELIEYPQGNTRTEYAIPDGVTSIGEFAFNSCDGLTSITIPDSVTSIGDSAFAYCDRLTNITIPNGVTSIGHSAFAYCYGLTSITIPNGVTLINHEVFKFCDALRNVIIPDGVTSIGDKAFDGCDGLRTITIPDSITSIGDFAFSSCEALTDVYYTGTQEDWCNIDIDSNNEDLLNATIHYNS